MNVDLIDVKNEVMDFMDKGKYLKPSKILFSAFKSMTITDIPSFGDLMVDLIHKYRDLFVEKIYVAFQYQLVNYVLKKDIIYFRDLSYELDKYIIEKYCLFDGEIITDFFYGALTDKYITMKGRMFITNLRIIASAYPAPISKTRRKDFSALWSNSLHYAIGKAIRKSLNKDIDELETVSYAHYYPIHNAYLISKEKNKIQYYVDIKYERKGKIKTVVLNLIISPGKMKENPARKEEILSNIESLLIQNK